MSLLSLFSSCNTARFSFNIIFTAIIQIATFTYHVVIYIQLSTVSGRKWASKIRSPSFMSTSTSACEEQVVLILVGLVGSGKVGAFIFWKISSINSIGFVLVNFCSGFGETSTRPVPPMQPRWSRWSKSGGNARTTHSSWGFIRMHRSYQFQCSVSPKQKDIIWVINPNWPLKSTILLDQYCPRVSWNTSVGYCL
jgi:hypothetical protein